MIEIIGEKFNVDLGSSPLVQENCGALGGMECSMKKEFGLLHYQNMIPMYDVLSFLKGKRPIVKIERGLATYVEELNLGSSCQIRNIFK